MSSQPTLILEVPAGSTVQRGLAASPPDSVRSGAVVVQAGPTDARGVLEAAAAGEVVMSAPSPETLRREPDSVARVIDRAGTGVEALVIEVGVAEEIREDELAVVVEASRRSARPVILRIIRGD